MSIEWGRAHWTLLGGVRYDNAASHADSHQFRQRMLHRQAKANWERERRQQERREAEDRDHESGN